MIVEQAVYGEVKGGHGLRTTSGDHALAAELAPRLDLPDTAPPGVDWSPFVSGFPYGDRYIIARTFRDPSATRAGMVLSHALIASIDAIVATVDLRSIFGALIIEPKAPTILSTLDISISKSPPPIISELSATAAALVTRGATGPVVRVDHQGFDELVISLWGQLWPALRRSFNFRLSFGPNDLVEDPSPVLVCTPASLVGRWQGYRLLDRFANEKKSLASEMLSGDDKSLRAFADAVDAELGSFGELALLEQAYRFAVLEPDLISNTLTSIRLIERLSPCPSSGEVEKDKLLNRFLLQLKRAKPNDILLLRNLRFHGFAQAESVWKVLAQCVAGSQFLATDDEAFLNVIVDAFTSGMASAEWCSAVLDGLINVADKSRKRFSTALWRWAEADPALTAPLWKHLNVDRTVETHLVAVRPQSLSQIAAQPILAYSVTKGLYRLHGATAVAAFSSIKAVRLQVGIEPISSSEGVTLMLGCMPPDQVVACAIDIGDPRLVSPAADAVAKKPELLKGIDMLSKTSRAIWSEALEINLDAWRGPGDPRAVFDTLLLNFLDDAEEVPIKLIDRLARTPLSDLKAFPRRVELWHKLDGPVLNNLLSATALAWLRDAEANPNSSFVEPELEEAILDNSELDVLLKRLASSSIVRAVHIVSTLDCFGETRFRRWLRYVASLNNSIPQVDADAIGSLALGRRWKGVVDDLLEMLRLGRDDVRPALLASISLVGFFDRLRYSLSRVTPAEKWDELVNLAAQLYPVGPDHDGLWERAGGQDADLGTSGPGRSRWRNAMTQIRHGRGPCIKDLLREMQNDYPGNIKLGQFAADDEFKSK